MNLKLRSIFLSLSSMSFVTLISIGMQMPAAFAQNTALPDRALEPDQTLPMDHSGTAEESDGAIKIAPPVPAQDLAPKHSPSPSPAANTPLPSAAAPLHTSFDTVDAVELKPAHKLRCFDDGEFAHEPKRWRFGLAVGVNLAESMQFDRVRFDSGTEVVDKSRLDYDSDPSMVVGLEALYSAHHDWGASFGFSIDSRHAIKNPDFASVGGTSATAINSAIVRVAVVYANFMYRWDHWYIPLGLNVSSVTVENPSLAIQDVHGGLGGQFGAGYFFDEDKFAVDVIARSLGVRGSSETDGVRTIDVRSGSLSAVQLNLKAYF